MGVKTCYRGNCNNILCECYSPEHGYICGECFEELVQRGPQADIGEFMRTQKPPENSEKAARARFEVEFPVRE